MARKRTPEERLQELEQRKKTLEEKVQRERQKLKREEHRRDTRRKVILGGALMEAAKQDESAAAFIADVMRNLNDRDRKAFEGWQPPKPQPAENAGASSNAAAQDSPSADQPGARGPVQHGSDAASDGTS